MTKKLYPMTFRPVYKDYLWGGSRIPETFHRPLPEGIYAESWEIADRNDGMSVVTNGPLAGQTLRALLEDNATGILGTRTKGTQFPLLIKLIDARQKLSVQVHPNTKTAATLGGEAKTEMWYLLGDNETELYCGLKKGITREDLTKAIDQGTCAETLRTIPVKKGDAVFVGGGSVHSIGENCLILEVQQNSNTTYRFYDWDRVDANGQPRELHIEKAVNAIDWNEYVYPLIPPELLVDTDGFQCWEILECKYFRVEKLQLSQPLEIPLDGSTFHALFTAEGEATIEWNEGTLTAPAGTSVLIPAALTDYTLAGNATVIRISLPGTPGKNRL